jgi:hypothetical protein
MTLTWLFVLKITCETITISAGYDDTHRYWCVTYTVVSKHEQLLNTAPHKHHLSQNLFVLAISSAALSMPTSWRSKPFWRMRAPSAASSSKSSYNTVLRFYLFVRVIDNIKPLILFCNVSQSHSENIGICTAIYCHMNGEGSFRHR